MISKCVVNVNKQLQSVNIVNMEWLHVALVLCSCILLSSAEEDKVRIKVASLPSPSEDVNPRIVGGAPTTIEKYNYAVQIIQSNSLACGGTLITARHVLTAAHCFYNNQGVLQNINQFSVRAGSRHLNRGAMRRISTLIIHPNYNRPLRDNDIAVLLLRSSFRFNATVGQAMLPTQNAQLNVNTPVWHVGWGAMWDPSVGPQTASPNLNEVQIYTINHEICISRYMELEIGPPPAPGQYTVTSNNLCSGILDVGGRDACQGDSGGPLVYNSRLVVGVTAWGAGCARPRYPGVNMRVSAYTTWINNTVNTYNASPGTNASGVLLLTLLCTVIFSSKM